QVLVQDLYSVESLAHVDTLCLDKTGTITIGKMKVTEVETYNKELLPITLEKIMQAYVKEADDSNSTFKALEEYYKGDYKLEKISDISFSSERKWSSITFKNLGTVIVGAPERLIEKSHEKEMPKIVTDAQK